MLRVVLLALLFPAAALAHSGKLDKHGCHGEREARHCHRDGDQRNTGQSSGRAHVIDGDSIKVDGIEMRLQGVDAVEGDQTCRRPDGSRWRCGDEARAALRKHLARQVLTCVHHGKDAYGRTLATCSLPDGGNVNEWLVRNGWAVAYRRYSTQYIPAESEARAAKRNIWSGTFERPDRYRQNK